MQLLRDKRSEWYRALRYFARLPTHFAKSGSLSLCTAHFLQQTVDAYEWTEASWYAMAEMVKAGINNAIIHLKDIADEFPEDAWQDIHHDRTPWAFPGAFFLKMGDKFRQKNIFKKYIRFKLLPVLDL